MRNGTEAQARHAANVVDLDSRREASRYKLQWLDHLQDADPPRHSIFAIAYAMTRFAVKTPRKVYCRNKLIAKRARVPLSQTKVDLKWMHDNGFLTFGVLTIDEIKLLSVRSSNDLASRVRVFTIPGNAAQPPVETQSTTPPSEADLFEGLEPEGGGQPVGRGVASRLAGGVASRLATESQSMNPKYEKSEEALQREEVPSRPNPPPLTMEQEAKRLAACTAFAAYLR